MNDTADNNPFSAVDATLGYLYQVRSALLWALRRLKSESEFLVSVETLDDVTFETTGGEATDLLQTKHHLNGTANLTDASTDLWKSLRIWFEGNTSGQIPQNANLYLITTAIASDGTAASKLRATSRDISAAQQALDATASTSTNKTNEKAYEAYLAASSLDRTAVLNRVTIIDSSSPITDLDLDLRQEVFWAVSKAHHSTFLERLEGWWLRRVLLQLITGTGGRIGSVEIEAQMSDLREQFKQDSLPIDDDLIDFSLDDTMKSAYQDFNFVKQLNIINAGKRRIASAIRDYYRAFEQRSRWIRHDLVVGMELHKYEKRLVEEWEIVFDAACDEIGADATFEVKEKAARSVLAWAERTTIPIRANVTEPFISRGSFHMLADEIRIGWHAEFRDRIREILKITEKTE